MSKEILVLTSSDNMPHLDELPGFICACHYEGEPIEWGKINLMTEHNGEITIRFFCGSKVNEKDWFGEKGIHNTCGENE